MVFVATFFGSSWIHLPLNESITQLRIRLDFLTGHPGPLLFAVGSVDFLYVEVTSSGRVVVCVDLGAGRSTLSSPPGVSSVADRRWHSIAVVLYRSAVQLTLDDVFQSRARLPGDFVDLDIDVGLRLGDVRLTDVQTVTPTQSTTTSFRGCLRSVVFNHVDVLSVSRREDPDTASRHSAIIWNRSKPTI